MDFEWDTPMGRSSPLNLPAASEERGAAEARGRAIATLPVTREVAVIILNYRTPSLTVECLASLDGQVEIGRDVVVVVENGSGDGSGELLKTEIHRRGWDTWVRLVRSKTTLGFPAGRNLGVRAADAEAYLLLNNGTIVWPSRSAASSRR